MSSYPVFSGSTFAPNTNLLPFDSNQNVNIPLLANVFQQNANMAFLSFPPPSLPGSHHVFQSGPRFPGAINTMLPASFVANIGNSNGMSPLGFAANIPGAVNLRPATPFAVNNNNLISPANYATNSAISALTSMPPPSISPWNPSPLPSSRNFPGNYQQLQNNQQKSSAHNLNPWAAVSSNTFQNVASFNQPSQSLEDVKPWIAESSISPNGFSNNNNERYFQSSHSSGNVHAWDNSSSTSTSNFDNFQNRAIKNKQTLTTFCNSVSPWSSESDLSNLSNNSQYSTMPIKNSPSKFRHSKSPVCDINPWAQPPPNLVGSSNYNFQISNERWKQNQQNFPGKKSYEQNFNQRRGNSRNLPNNNQNNNHRWQERKIQDRRDFKTESNESKSFACDTCDRSFFCKDEFQEHMSEHIKCNFKNCQFEAHPKIVALHKRMQHDTGYADAINKLKNSDDIEKWRAERRRRFPTSENILKRKAEQAEKEARGEVIENKEFGQFKKQKTEQREPRNNRFKKNRRNNKRNRFNAPSITVTVSDSGSDSDDDSHIKLHKFSGVFGVINTEASEKVEKEISSPVHNISEQSEEKAKYVTSESVQHLNERSIIEIEVEEKEKSTLEIETIDISTEESTSLYPINIDSDDDAPLPIKIVKVQSSITNREDSDDESPVEIPVSKVPLTGISNSASIVVKDLPATPFIVKNDKDSDDESPVEIPVSKVPLTEISNSASIVVKDLPATPFDAKNDKEEKLGKDFSRHERHGRNSNNRNNGPQYDNPVRKSTLLEKLLADDIRHERNVIMQCVRHVVKKNFFGIGSDS